MIKIMSLTALTSILLISWGLGATNTSTVVITPDTRTQLSTQTPPKQGGISRPAIPEIPRNPKMPTITPTRPGVPSNIVSPHDPVVPKRPGYSNQGPLNPYIPPRQGINRPVNPIQPPSSSYYIPRNSPPIPINPVRPVSHRPVRPVRHNPRIWFNWVSAPSPWYYSIYYSSPVEYYDEYPAQNYYPYYKNYNSYPYTDTNDYSNSLNPSIGDSDTSLTADPIQLQEEYDRWIISQLELNATDTSKFLKHLHKLQNLRMVFLDKRKILTDQLADFKNQGLEEEDLTNIISELNALDKKFQDDEKLVISKLLKGLSVEQQAKYYSLQSNNKLLKQKEAPVN